MKNLNKHDRIHFDPALSVPAGQDGLFLTPRVPCTVTDVGQMVLGNHEAFINSWCIRGDDGSEFWLLDDEKQEERVLLRLVAEAPHEGRQEPEWIHFNEYDIAHPAGGTVRYNLFSGGTIVELGSDLLLIRIFTRKVEDDDEFLWVALRNDDVVEYWIGVHVEPSQILRD